MRCSFFIFLCGLLLTACAGPKVTPPRDPAPAKGNRPIITATNDTLTISPGTSILGKITSFNAAGRFAVITFTVGKMPSLGQVLNVHRGGIKVGEVKITGPQRDTNTVGDIVAGEVRAGDEVREN